uniref:Major sperm protein n=1 Tax=Meloidogyne enterolobii TaxID=390850 RepID=A0A6V7USI1_MELEN|nr:unnamed protein product [Meloidogyne enterolobii]
MPTHQLNTSITSVNFFKSAASTIAMAVQVDPPSVQLPAGGGNVALKLINAGLEQRFAYKLRSSNNEHYRVNPVFGFVEPNSAATITVDRLPGPPKADDRLEICFTTVPPDAADARALFPPGSSGDFKLDVPVAAT